MLAKCGWCLLALCVTLAVAGPAGAGEKERHKDAAAERPIRASEVVVTEGSGRGIAPDAPQAIKDKIKAKIDAQPTTLRAPQRVQRTSWFGCQTRYAWRGASHWLGYMLYRYYVQKHWCSNGYYLYADDTWRWADTNAGWRFDGHIDSSQAGGNQYRSYYSQGSFTYPIGSWFQRLPWVRVWYDYNGGWSYSTGG